jgi:hypothetical protein
MLTSMETYQDSYGFRLTVEPATVLESGFVLETVRAQQQRWSTERCTPSATPSCQTSTAASTKSSWRAAGLELVRVVLQRHRRSLASSGSSRSSISVSTTQGEAPLAAFSQHHREVGGDPAPVMTGAAWPKWTQRGGVQAGQPGGVGKISQ